MKSQEELNSLKNECEELNKKLSELSEDELKEVTGGTFIVGSSMLASTLDPTKPSCVEELKHMKCTFEDSKPIIGETHAGPSAARKRIN